MQLPMSSEKPAKAYEPFYIQKGNVFAVPVTHYNMEMAAQTRLAFEEVSPDCVAVELAETMQLQLLHAASRLPDISVVHTEDSNQHALYYLCEPCDAAFEALRSALENQIAAYCIDLDIETYPQIHEAIPDPYAIERIGLKHYYEIYIKASHPIVTEHDLARELHMAKRLKELSLLHEKVLFVGGMAHIHRILDLMDRSSFPLQTHASRNTIQLSTLTENSARDVLAECGWFSTHYEEWRDNTVSSLDRHELILRLYKESAAEYESETGHAFPGYNFRNLMRFSRNYAIINDRLMPDLFQILSAAKGCVDHNYAYYTWVISTTYPFRRNVDNLPELDLTIDQVWGRSRLIRFHMKQPSRKRDRFKERLKKDRSKSQYFPPGQYGICSYPPEDLVIENFGNFLKKKGVQILTEEASRTIPFTSSIEDGIDTKETLRHWFEKKLYVKARGKPAAGVGSVVIIFDEDNSEDVVINEKYPWKAAWFGEHTQESDMAFYATHILDNIVGPGICRCEYGGLMMSYPPRRIGNIWQDPDYSSCRTKAEVLLMAAIDYAVQPIVVYVASKPPRQWMKSFASRYGKRVVYVPIGQLSPLTLNKLRIFHVLSGRDKREIAGDYIY